VALAAASPLISLFIVVDGYGEIVRNEVGVLRGIVRNAVGVP
jgi:hypothetical protein